MTPVSAMLLAGGGSRRMGRDKGGLPFGNGTLLEHQVAKLRRLGIGDIMISGRAADVAGARCVADIFPDQGPLGGLHACLAAARCAHCLAMAVDTPLVPEATLRALVEAHLSGGQGVTLLARDEQWEPLLAVYRADLAPAAARILEKGGGSPRDLIRTTTWRLVPYEGPEALLMNCNTPAEYRRALELAGFSRNT